MESGGYWMWEEKRKRDTKNPPYEESWEEQAFAEDAAGILGGCVWPPRSYSCSFCRREFRSAQALGGHMNVHRRDRARLKQSPCPQDEIRHHDELQFCRSSILSPQPPPSFQYPSMGCGLACSMNTHSDPTVLRSPVSEPSALSVPSTAEIFCEGNLFPPVDSSRIREPHHRRRHHHHQCPVYDYPRKSPSPSGEEGNLSSDDKFKSKNDCQKDSKLFNSGCETRGDCLQTDLSVSLNFVVCGTRPSLESETRETRIGCKRKRGDSARPGFQTSTSVERPPTHQTVFMINPNPSEDLDLELRLG